MSTTTITTTDITATLKANIGQLSQGDARFAMSLLSARNPSEKQMHWIGVLAERAIKAIEQITQPAETVSNVTGIVALLDRGHARLKFPKIAFQVEGRDLRLSIATDRARFPGSINVADPTGSEWYGRIHRDGRWEPSHRIDTGLADAVLAALRAFAADPAGIARQYGRLTGNCCFCCKALRDPLSVAAGFGPICADNYGLDRATEANASM